MGDEKNWIFPIVRREPIPDPYKGQRIVDEPGICMRWGCGQARWEDPEKGPTVLCKPHAEEVVNGKAKAPPLLRNIDYQTPTRVLIVDWPEESEKK
jgi:hypothetical protein